MGRPRGFDADEALERFMPVFREHGYEGAGTALLTKAMGISTTSRYAAFGNKAELFDKVLERCTEGPSAYLVRAMEEPTALGVATAILAGTVRTTIHPAHPHGCLGVHDALTTSDSGQELRDLLVAWRNDGCSRIGERFQRAVDDSDLPPQTDPGLPARCVTTFAYGIAVQAASDVTRDELQEKADPALRNWPPA